MSLVDKLTEHYMSGRYSKREYIQRLNRLFAVDTKIAAIKSRYDIKQESK